MIQVLMKQQLENPTGKISFKKTLDLLYFIEAENKADLLEVVIAGHPNMLSDKEILDFRFHYAPNNLERFSEIINQLNMSNDNNVGYHNDSVFKEVSIYIDDMNNRLINNPAAQSSLRVYLENNPIDMDSYYDLNEEGSQVIDRKMKRDYAMWVLAYGASEGETDLSKYMYQQALYANDVLKTIAILEYHAERSSYDKDYNEFDEMIKSNEIKQKLQQSLLNSNLSQKIKNEIEMKLRTYFY